MASSSDATASQPSQAAGEKSISEDFRDYFHVTSTYDNGGVGGMCTFCKDWKPDRTFPKRVLAHLGHVRLEGVGLCTKVPEDVKVVYARLCRQAGKTNSAVAVGGAVKRSHKRKSTCSSPTPGGSGGVTGSGSGGSGGQGGRLKQTFLGVKVLEQHKADVDRQVARFCYGTRVPFRVLSSTYWSAACSAIAQYGKMSGGNYKPPSMYQLRGNLLEQEKQYVEKVMEGLRTWKDYGITICTDAYT